MNTPNVVVGRLLQLVSLLVAVSIGLSAFGVAQAMGEDAIVRTLILLALAFALVLGLWLRLHSIVEAGMCGDRFAMVTVMLLTFGFALMPVLLPTMFAPQAAAMAPAGLPLTLAIMLWLMAVMVQRWLSQSSTLSSTAIADWQHVRNALVAAAAFFLISIALPREPTGVLGLSAQSLLWIILVVAQPLYIMLMHRTAMKAPVLATGQTLEQVAATTTPAPPTEQTRKHRRRGGRGRRHRQMSGTRRRL